MNLFVLIEKKVMGPSNGGTMRMARPVQDFISDRKIFQRFVSSIKYVQLNHD